MKNLALLSALFIAGCTAGQMATGDKIVDAVVDTTPVIIPIVEPMVGDAAWVLPILPILVAVGAGVWEGVKAISRAVRK